MLMLLFRGGGIKGLRRGINVIAPGRVCKHNLHKMLNCLSGSYLWIACVYRRQRQRCKTQVQIQVIYSENAQETRLSEGLEESR